MLGPELSTLPLKKKKKIKSNKREKERKGVGADTDRVGVQGGGSALRNRWGLLKQRP